MLDKLFSRTPRWQHEDPQERLIGVTELEAGALELVPLFSSDTDAQVRAAAAKKSSLLSALVARLAAEPETTVLAAIEGRAAELVSQSDHLPPEPLPQKVLALAASYATEPAQRERLLNALSDEAALLQLIATGGSASLRLAASERIATESGLEAALAASRNKDHGVAKRMRQKLADLHSQKSSDQQAETICASLEAVHARGGPILSDVVHLDELWAKLAYSGNPELIARHGAARSAIQARFDVELAAARAAQDEARAFTTWAEGVTQVRDANAATLTAQRTELEAWLAKPTAVHFPPEQLLSLERHFSAGERRVEHAQRALEIADEAESLTARDNVAASTLAVLQQRWLALPESAREGDALEKFEASVAAIKAKQDGLKADTQEARQRVHALLITAEQALTEGKTQDADAAFVELKSIKAAAGLLPKPTVQRIGQVQGQLAEFKRWQTYGEDTARGALIEKAEALVRKPEAPVTQAKLVTQLREEWKALDAKSATGQGAPKELWEKFDKLCERAYAPAAKHFAEQATKREAAAAVRETFLAAAAENAAQWANESVPLKDVEAGIRKLDQEWRTLGGVAPEKYKALENRFKEAISPAQNRVTEARAMQMGERQVLIKLAEEWKAKALDREAPSAIKALQSRWQEQAKAAALPHKEETKLWNAFRAACNAVFESREASRNEAKGKASALIAELDAITVEFDGLAEVSDEGQLRKSIRDIGARWQSKRKAAGERDPSLRDTDRNFQDKQRKAENALRDIGRKRDLVLWQAVEAREALCGELELLASRDDRSEAINSIESRWSGLAAPAKGFDEPLKKRFAAALANCQSTTPRPLSSEADSKKRGALLELELAIGIDSPAELANERRALQLTLLAKKFQGGGSGQVLSQLQAFCAIPGNLSDSDRGRFSRLLLKSRETQAR